MLLKVVAELPVVAAHLVFDSIVVGALNGPRKVHQSQQSRAEGRFGDGNRHPCKADHSDVDEGGFTVFIEGSGVDECVVFVFTNPIVVHRDVKVPVFNGAVRSQPVGEFGAVAVLVKLLQLDLDLDVVRVAGIGRAFDRKGVACKVEGLVHRSRHGDVVPQAVVVVGWWRDDDSAAVLQGCARTVEDRVKSAGGVHETEAPLVVPTVRDARLGGRTFGL